MQNLSLDASVQKTATRAEELADVAFGICAHTADLGKRAHALVLVTTLVVCVSVVPEGIILLVSGIGCPERFQCQL